MRRPVKECVFYERIQAGKTGYKPAYFMNEFKPDISLLIGKDAQPDHSFANEQTEYPVLVDGSKNFKKSHSLT